MKTSALSRTAGDPRTKVQFSLSVIERCKFPIRIFVITGWDKIFKKKKKKKKKDFRKVYQRQIHPKEVHYKTIFSVPCTDKTCSRTWSFTAIY